MLAPVCRSFRARAHARFAGFARAAGSVAFAFALGGTACHALAPENKPVEACERACNKDASRQCAKEECARGCEFILDRLVEKETRNVVACVARMPRRCSDVVWAECAAHVGVHADGGPPAPPPPMEDD